MNSDIKQFSDVLFTVANLRPHLLTDEPAYRSVVHDLCEMTGCREYDYDFRLDGNTFRIDLHPALEQIEVAWTFKPLEGSP